jgi:hypothetical protein
MMCGLLPPGYPNASNRLRVSRCKLQKIEIADYNSRNEKDHSSSPVRRRRPTVGRCKSLKPFEISCLADSKDDSIMLCQRHWLNEREIQKLSGVIVKTCERHTHSLRLTA